MLARCVYRVGRCLAISLAAGTGGFIGWTLAYALPAGKERRTFAAERKAFTAESPDAPPDPDRTDRWLAALHGRKMVALLSAGTLAAMLGKEGRLTELADLQAGYPKPFGMYAYPMALQAHRIAWEVLLQPGMPAEAVDLAAQTADSLVSSRNYHPVIGGVAAAADPVDARHTLALARLRQGRFGEVEPLCARVLSGNRLPDASRATILATVALALRALRQPHEDLLSEAEALSAGAAVVPEATGRWHPVSSGVPEPLIGKDALAPPAPPRRRRPRRLLVAVAGVAAIALAAGLTVWHPWDPPPAAPAALRGTSPTATSVRLTWPASTGGNVAHYLMLRDGKQVDEIPASETSWTDQRLAPGMTHKYAVKAQGSGGTSGLSAAAAVTTITPSPVGLRLVKANWVSATLAWHPSPLGPVPTRYVIYDATTVVDTIPGTTDTYVDDSLMPGGSFSYSVAAQWGRRESKPSAVLSGSTLAPPLDGAIPVSVAATSVPAGSTGPSNGEVKTYQWSFHPTCSATGCLIETYGYLPSNTTHYTQFTTLLAGSGTTYSGSIKGEFSHCSTVSVTDTLAVHLTAAKGHVANGSWLGWTGTVVLTEPYTTVGSNYHCPTQSWYFSLSGKP